MLNSGKRRIGACAAVAVFLCTPLLANCDSKSAEQYIRDAETDRAAGKLSAAIIDVKNALQKDAKNLTARVLLARFYLDLPDPAGAEAELLRARQDGADASIIARPLAEAELMLGKPQLALKEAEIADTAPTELKASLIAARASALMATGDMTGAQSALEAALKADPHSVDALTAMAQYRLVRGDFAPARQSLAEAQKLAPKSATLFSLQGAIDFAAGDATASEQSFQDMLGVASWSLPARVGMARAQIAENKLKEAIANLDIVLRSAPNDPNTNYLRALAAYRDSDFATAQVHIQRTRSATKDSPPVLLLGGATAYALKQYEEANTLLSQYVYLVPKNVQARKLLAATEVAVGRSTEAVKTLSSAVDQGTKDPQLLAMIGEASARSGDLISARRYLSMAVERTPDNVPLRTELGLTEVSLGDADQGIEELEKATNQDPEDLRPEIALFTALLRKQDYDKALEVAEKVQKSHPSEAPGFDMAGLAQLAKGDADTARTGFLKARDLRPGDAVALRMLSALEVRAGNLTAANGYLQEILKTNPKDTGASVGLAQIEAQSGHPEQTEATLKAAIQQSPDDLTPSVALARFYLASGRHQDALNEIAPGLQKSPKEAALLEISGVAQLNLRNFPAAIQAFTMLAEVQPQSSTAHRYLSETYAVSGDLDSALAEAKSAVKLDDHDLASKLTLARVYLTRKNYADARSVADGLAQQAPQDAHVAELQANIALADTRPEDAISAFKREMAIADNNLVRVHLANAEARAGHLSDAEGTLLPWIAAHPDDAVARLALGDIYLGANRQPDAEAQYAAILEKNPNNVVAENNLAWVMAAQDQMDSALQHARHAASLAPERSQILDTLGVVLLQTGKADEAVETLRKAVALKSPGDPEIQFHLAQALVQTGKKEDARESLRAVLKNEQPFKDREQAEKLLAELGS